METQHRSVFGHALRKSSTTRMHPFFPARLFPVRNLCCTHRCPSFDCVIASLPHWVRGSLHVECSLGCSWCGCCHVHGMDGWGPSWGWVDRSTEWGRGDAILLRCPRRSKAKRSDSPLSIRSSPGRFCLSPWSCSRCRSGPVPLANGWERGDNRV